MRKKTGIVLVVLGAVLLVAALLSALYNSNRDRRAGERADEILDELRGHIVQRAVEYSAHTEAVTSVTEEDTTAVTVPHEENEPAPIMVNGHDCIGFIEIPSLELVLPILSDWSDEKLDIAPCRHFGSAVTDDLVIAGHNFTRHLSYLSKLTGGEAVVFTDTAGVTYHYTVTAVKHISEENVDAVQNSGHDLVLYTCTFMGDIRTAVFCDRIK